MATSHAPVSVVFVAVLVGLGVIWFLAARQGERDRANQRVGAPIWVYATIAAALILMLYRMYSDWWLPLLHMLFAVSGK